MKNLNSIYPGMKSKRKSSEGRKKSHARVNSSNATPTPEVMLYDNSANYTKYNPMYKDFSSFNRKISQKVGASGMYAGKLTGNKKGRSEREKSK